MVIRQAERNCVCRGCDKMVKKGTRVFYTYSSRNKGQHIFFCMECLEKIAQMQTLENGIMSGGVLDV